MLVRKYLCLFTLWVIIFHLLGLKQMLLEYSIRQLPVIKKDQSFMMWFLAFWGGEVGQSWACLCGRHYLRRDQALIVVTALALGNSANSILKTFWHEPRPFFLSEEIIPARCTNFEYGLPSGHTMGFIVVYRTLVKLVQTKHQLLIQASFIVSLCFVSYNRAQQQVHSFDQLLDGFVMGMLMSEFLTEPAIRDHFEQMCLKMKD